MLLQLLQDGGVAATDTASVLQTPVEEQLDYIELVLKGGIIMIPIAVLLIIGLYLTIERWLTIRKARRFDANFIANVKDLVSSGNIAGAKNLCQRTSTPIARMLEKGISRIGKPMKNIEVAIEIIGFSTSLNSV